MVDNDDKNVLNDMNLLKSMENMATYLDNKDSKLLEYQEPHAKQLIEILSRNNTALDASDPGIGKTYIAAHVCKVLNLVPVIICPKSVISKWGSVLDEFGVKYLMVTNYELISRGKYVYKKAKIASPNIKIIKKDKRLKYEWAVDKNVIFIFDEVHRCKYLSTMNAKLLLAAKETGNKILMLSATVVEKPIEFVTFAYVLGFSTNLRVLSDWIKKLSAPAKTIHTMLYPKENPLASRLTIEELGDKFPETQITAETYSMKGSNEISKVYEQIAEKIKKYKEEGEHSKFIIAKLQTEFRNIELLKIPTFIELAKDYIENGYSVVIFVNYTDTLNMLAKELDTNILIHGGQTVNERDANVEAFQNDKSRILIANIRAGGVGISLHDINGKYPRVSLISPTQSATNLIQALGRIHRSGGKSKSLQRIIFAANTPEDDISKMLFRKLANLSLLNDGDLETYYIDGLMKDEHAQLELSNGSTEKDLKIIIDEQMERIKHKNIVKVERLSQLFPHAIDEISGVNNIYLLKGRDIFSDIEILLLGETHVSIKPCRKCHKNCIDVLDIVSYATHCLHPQMLDFYIEKPYNPHIKNKFYFGSSFDNASRIEKFYNAYKHLLDQKNPMTEKLRMHAVDIRHSFSTGINTPNDRLLDAYGVLYVFGFNVIGYWYYDAMTNYLRPEERIRIDYKRNKEFFDRYKDDIDYVYKYLIIPENYELIKKILNGDDEMRDIFKITKQKTKFTESYDDKATDFANKFDNEIKNMFIDGSEIFDYLMYMKGIMDSLRHIDDTKTFMNEFLGRIYGNKKAVPMSDDDTDHSSTKLIHTLSAYMDNYAMYRMLRKFDEKQQKNVIFYGGSFHSKNMCQRLVNTGYFKLIVKKNEYSSHGQPEDCAILQNH
jgi:superfamily II DNA or RNA helicase